MDAIAKQGAAPLPLAREDGSLYAVLTAAVAQTFLLEGVNPERGFVICSAKAVNTPSAKKLTVRDAELHAVITAAVARVLEAEGRDPETGFAIRSVKAV